MFMLRAIRALGFWGILTLLLIYVLVGSVVERMFSDKNSLPAEITGNVVGDHGRARVPALLAQTLPP